ncbi:hypothetical protein AB0L44_13765 [Nonomuraea wenchangensis]|uniref:hypothetical protein n=1 Tax=Nonomuraea wenchangensis TaxID=568860 RepID=UPI003435ECA3
MTNTDTPVPSRVTSSPPRRSAGIRRLRCTVALALVRGAAHATGAGLVGLLFWWITHR